MQCSLVTTFKLFFINSKFPTVKYLEERLQYSFTSDFTIHLLILNYLKNTEFKLNIFEIDSWEFFSGLTIYKGAPNYVYFVET